MKKQIVSAIVLAGMITSSAFASDARELVMGYGGADTFSNGGSFYYDSAYNFFYNPAYVNDFKNWAIFEKGNGNDGSSAGFVTSMMNFNLGMFFNRNAAMTDRSGFGGGNIGSNALDVMLGGDTGVKWGLGLTYGRDSNASLQKETNLDVRVGASFAGLDPFATFKIIGNDKAGSTTINKYTNMGVGLRYHFGEWVPYAAFNTAKRKVEAAGTDTKNTSFVVGAGRETKLAEGARLVYALYYENSKTSTTPATTDTKSNSLPIDMAVEADALSWLTLRAGLNHVLFGTDNAGSAKPTTARIGGTFHVAKVDVDYAFGNTAAGAAANAPTPDSENIGFDGGTFHKVALRYSW